MLLKSSVTKWTARGTTLKSTSTPPRESNSFDFLLHLPPVVIHWYSDLHRCSTFTTSFYPDRSLHSMVFIISPLPVFERQKTQRLLFHVRASWCNAWACLTLIRTTARLSSLMSTPGHGDNVFLSIYAGKTKVHLHIRAPGLMSICRSVPPSGTVKPVVPSPVEYPMGAPWYRTITRFSPSACVAFAMSGNDHNQ